MIIGLNKNAQVITTCLKSHGNPLIKVVVSFYNQTTLCFNPALLPVLQSVKPLLTDLRQVDTTVANLAPGLENCTNDICVFGVSIVISILLVMPIKTIMAKEVNLQFNLIRRFWLKLLNKSWQSLTFSKKIFLLLNHW